MKSSNLLLVIIALIVFTGAGFFGGIKYQQSRTFNNFRNGAAFGNGNFRGEFGQNSGQNGTRGMRGGQVVGQITSADNNSLTVKTNDGSSRIVLFTSGTSVNKATAASTTDLKPNETVAVFGQINSDGSVTATNIQLNPILRGQGGTPSPAPTK